MMLGYLPLEKKTLSASLTLVGGREHIKINLGSYQIGKLQGRKPTSATLCKHRARGYYIHIQIKDEAPEPTFEDGIIGIDLGVILPLLAVAISGMVKGFNRLERIFLR